MEPEKIKDKVKDKKEESNLKRKTLSTILLSIAAFSLWVSSIVYHSSDSYKKRVEEWEKNYNIENKIADVKHRSVPPPIIGIIPGMIKGTINFLEKTYHGIVGKPDLDDLVTGETWQVKSTKNYIYFYIKDADKLIIIPKETYKNLAEKIEKESTTPGNSQLTYKPN